jgi:Zn-dependent peptidase ImmA (M78 family)
MHELIHLMLAAGHEEESALKETRSEKQWEGVERFTENAASHVLVPEAALEAAVGSKRKNSSWDIEEVRRLARHFRISPLAMATRLRASDYMNWPAYQNWKDRWNAYLKTLKPSSGGFASPAEKSINRNGKPFVQLVLEALDSNRITSVDAAHYLDLKYQHFQELRETIRFGINRTG